MHMTCLLCKNQCHSEYFSKSKLYSEIVSERMFLYVSLFFLSPLWQQKTENEPFLMTPFSCCFPTFIIKSDNIIIVNYQLLPYFIVTCSNVINHGHVTIKFRYVVPLTFRFHKVNTKKVLSKNIKPPWYLRLITVCMFQVFTTNKIFLIGQPTSFIIIPLNKQNILKIKSCKENANLIVTVINTNIFMNFKLQNYLQIFAILTYSFLGYNYKRKFLLLTSITYQGYSLCHRKLSPKFEIEVLFQQVMT
ncbi:hypothetical protein AGLY_002898 [Aphis glycines]|uniref:Uncharacterized protein n=1 Tax=Aphis glycines TaxID=307491 RepID=A0A6G0U1Z5_APHGL|nr:hypothetical protein AGLY_002898 [Aphis glycines]